MEDTRTEAPIQAIKFFFSLVLEEAMINFEGVCSGFGAQR